ncbi:hypothetical protein CI238_11251, partial [Colletotrichum incanum]
MGSDKFSYNAQTLKNTILKEMENNSWVGVCCELNGVFVVSNQFLVHFGGVVLDMAALLVTCWVVTLGFVTKIETEVRLNRHSVGAEFRKRVKEPAASPNSRETLEAVLQNFEFAKKKNSSYTKPMFGDKRFEDNLDWTCMNPLSGNAAIGYRRLDVEDGRGIMTC